MQAGLRRVVPVHPLAETQHKTLLAGLNPVKAGQEPGHQSRGDHQGDAEAAHTAARQH